MNGALADSLKKLRLSGMVQSLNVRLQEASASRLTHAEFLELIVQDELAVRNDRAVDRRTRAARFRDQKTLEAFDWNFNPTIRRKQIFDLAAGEFVRKHTDVLFFGPPGTGKSHCAQAIGHALIRAGWSVYYRSIFDAVRDLMHDEAFDNHEQIMARYLRPDLLILDDMGIKSLPKRSGEFLFEIIMRRHELRSTLMTSNRPLEDWGKLIGDVPSATAILDRFLQSAEIIEFKGRSYRLSRRHGKMPTTTSEEAENES
ncbi:MAG: IS21-like element helper ATPase IstB [Planctomycetaceae bacterium]